MIIGIDFDGTCVKHEFPDIGADIGAVPVLKKLVQQGHQLILWTMRSDGSIINAPHRPEIHGKEGHYLTDAVNWFKDNDIPLYGIQRNPEQNWTTSPKAYCHLYIDDAALGCPLTCDINYGNLNIDGRPYVNWIEVQQLLYERGILQ